MANETHLAELKKGVKHWNAWVIDQRKEINSFFADLRGAYLHGADLCGANLKGTDLRRVEVNADTNFEKVSMTARCIIEMYTLECLGPDYGGLTTAQRMDMVIKDDAADLMFEFTGWRRWAHLIAMAAFLAPYILYLLNAKLYSTIGYKTGFPFQETDTPSIWSGLWSYFLHGGLDASKPVNLWIVASAAVMLLYNLIRFALLKKSADLEHRKFITSLPQKFSLSDAFIPIFYGPTVSPHRERTRYLRYRHLILAMKGIFYVAILSAIVHTIIFFSAPSPSDDQLWQHLKDELQPALVE